MEEKRSGMEGLDEDFFWKTLLECYARTNGIVIKSVILRDKVDGTTRELIITPDERRKL